MDLKFVKKIDSGRLLVKPPPQGLNFRTNISKNTILGHHQKLTQSGSSVAHREMTT